MSYPKLPSAQDVAERIVSIAEKPGFPYSRALPLILADRQAVVNGAMNALRLEGLVSAATVVLDWAEREGLL